MDGRLGEARLNRRRLLGGAAAGVVAAGVGGSAAARVGRRILPASGDEPATRMARPARHRWNPEVIGHSVEGRPITMYTNLAERPRFTLMTISVVHGDERGAGSVGADVLNAALPDGVSGFAIPLMNPDGWARGDRLNANGVDLNRNFPSDWLALDGGPAPLSEPESRSVAAVIEAIRPSLIVWIHQPYDYISPISPSATDYAQAWGDAAGLQLRTGINQHGGGESWAAYVLGLSSILVEAPTYEGSVEVVAAQRRGLEALLAAL